MLVKKKTAQPTNIPLGKIILKQFLKLVQTDGIGRPT